MVFNKFSLFAALLVAATLLFLTLFQGVFSLRQIYKINKQFTGSGVDRIPASQALGDLRVRLSELHSLELLSVLSSDPVYREHCQARKEIYRKSIQEDLAECGMDTAEEDEKIGFREWNSLWQEYLKMHENPQALPGQDPTEQAMVLSQHFGRMQQLLDKQAAMNAQFFEEQSYRSKQTIASSQSAVAVLMLVNVILVTCLLVILFLLKFR